ncbi:uncharacterized protein PV06_10700 [Exophiala oligosperma]|uniref:HIG1 domain-containing protein n=2 Tax=Chaetothyriales TaxID=34395 RepID=A0A0D2A9Q9_9EURO|nr:uncharacterized protein PV06_10700 [Exophiala oligosperma]KAJ9640176.1 Respiratory supercomplex factor 1, mitochondrial [Knufia peltigerae]KIW37071.1 hypothetical protein PV06_10700 [Exophiala oligosperma]
MSNPNATEPSPLSETSVPSSFDNEFFEESRFQKFWRKIRQEPLIPVGCAATCYALWMATRSIRAGDHHQTNRMFRARIYAQGFTLLALVAGSYFYKDERIKRKAFESALDEKKTAEKREKWLRELEARDQEDREWRDRIEKASADARAGVQDIKQSTERLLDDGKESLKKVEQQIASGQPGEGEKKSSWKIWSRSVQDEVILDGWGPGMWATRTRDAWRRF